MVIGGPALTFSDQRVGLIDPNALGKMPFVDSCNCISGDQTSQHIRYNLSLLHIVERQEKKNVT
jgi:hypothetical protein